MAQINIITTPEERSKLLVTLKQLEGQTIAMSAIAKKAGVNPNRVRYIIDDLCDEKRLRKVPTKAFNAHYIRYKYEVVEG